MSGILLFRKWLNGADTLYITSEFGRRGSRNHNGVDIQAAVGTPIYAPISGTLTARRQGNGTQGWGNYLLLKHGETTLLFAHLSRFASLSLNSTREVKVNQLIGYTGQTGNACGPHLHLEYRLNGQCVNPINYISDQCVSANNHRNVIRYKRKVIKSTNDSRKIGGVVDAPYYRDKKTFAISLYYFYFNALKNDKVARFMVAQDAAESGWGTTNSAQYNFGNVNSKGTSGYGIHAFSSCRNFVNYKVSQFRKHWPSSLRATTIEDFVGGLYPGTGRNYAGASQSTYLRKVEGCLNGKRFSVNKYINSVGTFSYTDNDGVAYADQQNTLEDDMSAVSDTDAVYNNFYEDEDEPEQQQVTIIDYDDDEPEEEDFGDEVVTDDQQLAAGIWQIVKMAEDSDVGALKLYDTSIGMQTGPLMGFFNRVCQQPLVEFSGDTYGDQYYYLIRRPPFDQAHILKCLDILGIGDVTVEEDNPYYIRNADIIRSNIVWNSSDIYSWYQYFPIYEIGDAESMQYLTPAVFFPEYAAIWGSRSMSVRSQYRSFVNTDVYDNEKSVDRDETLSQVIEDFRYLVESNAYNPFIRRGTITIRGNRKIKRGTFVRVQLDDSCMEEIYYVESVSQSYAISVGGVNRTTTLQLSHGMVRQYIGNRYQTYAQPNGKTVDKAVPSYFNLIDFGKKKTVKSLDSDGWRAAISDWKVNKETFNFFVRRLQFVAGI